MAQIIKIKNDSGSIVIWSGKEFAVDEEYTIQMTSVSKWRNNDTFLSAITSGDALIGNASDYFTSSSLAINWLNGDTSTHIANPFPDNEGGYSFRGKGGNSSCVSGNNDVDQLIHATEARLINGAEIWTDSGAYGEYITFQVVDVDNVFGYGAGTILEEFGDCWQIHPLGGPTKAFPGYIANVPAGIYIRMKVNVSEACNFHFNLHLHKS